MVKRVALLLLLTVGVLLLFAGLGYGWFNSAIATPAAAELPDRVAGLPLVQASYGPEAVAEVTRLHDQSFPLSSGAFGMYGRDGSMVMLWVTGTPAKFVAERIVAAMEKSIGEAESPFTPTGSQEVNGRTIYELTGMGQSHYYFRSGSIVIWLAADEAIDDIALTEILAFYP
jgi:hypothetical protein